ncbi:MAG: electron transport complex subunit RsxE [Mycoplasmatales bacterium]
MNKFNNTLINENPTFVQFLGLCPTLAVTVLFSGAIWMGISVTIVLVLSTFFISLFKNLIPDGVRIPVYTTIIATIVTLLIMILETYAPSIYTQLGIYLPLIVVNCIVLGRAEAFASKNTVRASVYDGFITGIVFLLSLSVIGFVRELFGTGQIKMLHISIMQLSEACQLFTTGAGAFFTLGLLAWAFNSFKRTRDRNIKKEVKVNG